MPELVYGFDIDGTITAAPEAMRELMAALIEAGHHVAVLTGSMGHVGPDTDHRDKRTTQLEALGIHGGTHYDSLSCYGDGPDAVAKEKAAEAGRTGMAMMFEDSLQYALHIAAHCPVMVMYPRG